MDQAGLQCHWDKLDTILAKRDGCGGNFSYQLGLMKGYGGFPVGMMYLSMIGLCQAAPLISTTTVPADGRFHHVAITFSTTSPANIVVFTSMASSRHADHHRGSIRDQRGPVLGSPCELRLLFHRHHRRDRLPSGRTHAAQIQSRVPAGSAGYCDPPDADLLVKTAVERLDWLPRQ